jgi:hypothetical protein
MYRQTEVTVKSKDNLSDYVCIDRGVKRGDSLKPNLFKLYINDLPDIFDQNCFPITLDKISINCLMFADDLLLLSETPEGLQNCIDKLNSYCNRWQLSINIQKTKVMVFQQRNIIYNNHEFFLNGIKLEKVLKYKYLGIIIEASGKLNSSFTELSKKEGKILFSIFKYLSPLERVSIKIYIKLFESLVKPVLMYNSEIWYMDFHEKISNVFNRAQIMI